MKFGLTDTQLSMLQKLLIAPLKNQKAKVYIFGSRARGKHHHFSDLDVLYIPDPKSNISKYFISEIREILENSNLPIKIDLVLLDDLAESYKKQVLEEMVEI